MRSRSAFLNAACASQILEKQAVKCGGAPVPVHSRHHQRLRGVGFKWNWRRCCIWFALLQIAINARDVSACASVFSVRSAHQPFPHGVGFLLEPTPASLLPAVPKRLLCFGAHCRPLKGFRRLTGAPLGVLRRLACFSGLVAEERELRPFVDDESQDLLSGRFCAEDDAGDAVSAVLDMLRQPDPKLAVVI